MTKSPDAFRTISEVADWLGVQAHVLRFWESKFTQIKPVKRAGGRRYYRPGDMQLLGGIKALLHDEGLTIKGVQKILREQGVSHVSSLSQSLDESAASAPATADEPDATVLQFTAKAAPVAPPEPKIITPSPTAPREDTPQAGTPIADGDSGARESAPAPETAQEPTPTPDAATLPSFLHKPAPPPQPEPGPEPVSETAAEDASPSEPTPRLHLDPTPPPPRPVIIDAPDPPADSDLPYSPGVLARLAKLDRLPPDSADKIAPLVAQLRGWVDRAGHADAV